MYSLLEKDVPRPSPPLKNTRLHSDAGDLGGPESSAKLKNNATEYGIIAEQNEGK